PNTTLLVQCKPEHSQNALINLPLIEFHAHLRTPHNFEGALTTEHSAPCPAPCHSFPGFFVRRATPFSLALVPKLLAFRQRQLDLDSTVLEVHANWYQGQPLLLGLADQLADLFAMHQQLAGPQRSVIVNVPVLVRTDMRIQQPELPILD